MLHEWTQWTQWYHNEKALPPLASTTISDYLIEGEGTWWRKLPNGNIEFFDITMPATQGIPSNPSKHHFRSSKTSTVRTYLLSKWMSDSPYCQDSSLWPTRGRTWTTEWKRWAWHIGHNHYCGNASPFEFADQEVLNENQAELPSDEGCTTSKRPLLETHY